MLPDFIVIGAQKSASTFILTCLKEHPDIFMPNREVDFFEDPIYHESKIDQLEGLLAPASPEKLIGIKRPNYLARPECAERINRHCPDAKIIVVLRNPVERAVSAYFHYMNYSFVPVRSIEKGLMDIICGKYKHTHPGSRDIIEYGFYYKHLARYLAYFDSDRIHITLFDDIKSNAPESIRRIYSFLMVDDDYVPSSIGKPRNTVVYSLARLRLRTIRNRFIYTYDRERSRSYLKQPSRVGTWVNRLISAIDNRIMTRICGNEKPRLSSSLTNRLFQIYQEDIANLESLLGRHLWSWKQGQGPAVDASLDPLRYPKLLSPPAQDGRC